MTRTFLIVASMPTYFWLDTAYMVVYTINRLPNPIFENKIPSEVLFQRAPDYSFLKPFSCACFSNFMASFATKLQLRSIQCVFLGFATNYKGYLCVDPILGQVYVSRHVCFHENHYPFPMLVRKAPQLPQPFVFCPDEIQTLTHTSNVVPLG